MIADNKLFSLEQCAECEIPGYLVLRLKGGETSLAELPADKAQALGNALALAARAVEEATGAERVYVLSFCEVDRRLHFHLFPRTAWLAKEYAAATGRAGGPLNGPALFEWARRTMVGQGRLPAGAPGKDAVLAAIRAIWGRPG